MILYPYNLLNLLARPVPLLSPEPWEVGILSVFYPCSKTDPWWIRTAPTSSFGSRREKAFDGICSTAQCRVKGLLPSGGGLRMSPTRSISSAALVLLVYLKQTIPANDGDIWAPPSPTTSRHSLSAWLFPLSPWIRKSQDALFVVSYLKYCDTALWSS